MADASRKIDGLIEEARRQDPWSVEAEAVEANALKVWLDIFAARAGRVPLAETGDLGGESSRLARRAAAVADAAERMARDRLREAAGLHPGGAPEKLGSAEDRSSAEVFSPTAEEVAGCAPLAHFAGLPLREAVLRAGTQLSIALVGEREANARARQMLTEAAGFEALRRDVRHAANLLASQKRGAQAEALVSKWRAVFGEEP